VVFVKVFSSLFRDKLTKISVLIVANGLEGFNFIKSEFFIMTVSSCFAVILSNYVMLNTCLVRDSFEIMVYIGARPNLDSNG